MAKIGNAPCLPSPPPPNPEQVKSPLRSAPAPGSESQPRLWGALRTSARCPGCQAPFCGHSLLLPTTGSWGSARPMARALQVPARAALSAGAAWGSPAGGTGSIRSARQGPGHNAALPLDARAPGAPQTPARLRLDRSVLSRPGLGQLLPAWDRSRPPAGKRRPTGLARGGGARRPASCLTATPAQSASDMSAQEPPQGRRFPIEAGDSPGLAFPRETQDSPERVATEHNPVR